MVATLVCYQAFLFHAIPPAVNVGTYFEAKDNTIEHFKKPSTFGYRLYSWRLAVGLHRSHITTAKWLIVSDVKAFHGDCFLMSRPSMVIAL
jgi:hypothetical protein